MDGVLEMTPFPHDSIFATSSQSGSKGKEEKPQGMLKVHKLPIFHERGGGGTGSEATAGDWAFALSRKRFKIEAFSLPPVEGDNEAQQQAEGSAAKAKDLEF